MKNIENLNKTWYKQEKKDILNLSGTTNIYGKLNIFDNNFGYIKSILFNTYTGSTNNVLNNAIKLNINSNSYNIANRLGINNNNPQAYLDIFTTGRTTGFKLVDGSQSEGNVLTTDNKGFGTWKPIVNSIRTDLNSNGTLLNHNLNKIPSFVSFYGKDRSLNFDWSYNKSGLNQYKQIFIYSNLELKDVIVNII